VASAVSTGAIPGCSGRVVEVLLCITGTSTAEVLDPSLTALPDQIPYGGTESVNDLYNHCVYHPPFLYGDPPCNPDSPVGDPWEVLAYARDALGTQLLGLILGALILAYGVLQISLGLSAGMMFVLFPVAAIFAFYLPLESFPAGVIRNYINIFLKSVVLLTLASAQQEGQKAFYVFPDATLERIAAARPQTMEELEAVKGVGPKKLQQYGDAILAAVRDITREEGGVEA
jgi:hypothetical protein